MHVFLPFPDVPTSVYWMAPADAALVCLSALEVAAVIHETHDLTHILETHPVVRMWRGYEVSLLDYAFQINERMIRLSNVPANYKRDEIDNALSRHMDLATSGTFEMRLPPWVHEKPPICNSHMLWLVSQNPTWYRREIERVTEFSMVIPLWENTFDEAAGDDGSIQG